MAYNVNAYEILRSQFFYHSYFALLIWLCKFKLHPSLDKQTFVCINVTIAFLSQQCFSFVF